MYNINTHSSVDSSRPHRRQLTDVIGTQPASEHRGWPRRHRRQPKRAFNTQLTCASVDSSRPHRRQLTDVIETQPTSEHRGWPRRYRRQPKHAFNTQPTSESIGGSRPQRRQLTDVIEILPTLKTQSVHRHKRQTQKPDKAAKTRLQHAADMRKRSQLQRRPLTLIFKKSRQ